jgi:hypothetical protein
MLAVLSSLHLEIPPQRPPDPLPLTLYPSIHPGRDAGASDASPDEPPFSAYS